MLRVGQGAGLAAHGAGGALEPVRPDAAAADAVGPEALDDDVVA